MGEGVVSSFRHCDETNPPKCRTSIMGHFAAAAGAAAGDDAMRRYGTNDVTDDTQIKATPPIFHSSTVNRGLPPYTLSGC